MKKNKTLFSDVNLQLYDKWRSYRYINCNNSMPLWFGINSSNITIVEQRGLTKDEWKNIVLDYPFDTNGCLCKMCRYRRWYGK